MGLTRPNSIPARAWVAVLALLVALCAADLARPEVVMAGDQDCAGPACETQIACGPLALPPVSSGAPSTSSRSRHPRNS